MTSFKQNTKDSQLSSLAEPSSLQNADISGAGTGCRIVALHHSLGYCDHSQNILSIMARPRLNFPSLRARILYRGLYMYCSFPPNPSYSYHLSILPQNGLNSLPILMSICIPSVEPCNGSCLELQKPPTPPLLPLAN